MPDLVETPSDNERAIQAARILNGGGSPMKDRCGSPNSQYGSKRDLNEKFSNNETHKRTLMGKDEVCNRNRHKSSRDSVKMMNEKLEKEEVSF